MNSSNPLQAVYCPATQIGQFIGLIALALSLLLNTHLAAQDPDDPFGDSSTTTDVLDTPEDSAFGQPEAIAAPPSRRANSAGDAKLPPSDHPIVVELDLNPPRNGQELARASLYMSRLQQWERLKRYLQQLAAMNIDGSMATRLIEEIGTDRWLSIRNQADGHLTDEELQIIGTLFEKSSELIRNDHALATYYQSLQSVDIVEVRRGIRGYLAAGSAGLAHLLQRVANDSQPPTRSMIETLRSFEEAGTMALVAALTTDDPKERESLIRLAEAVPSRSVMRELLSVVHLDTDTPLAKGLASQLLSENYGTLPDAPAVTQFLTKELSTTLRGLQSLKTIDVPLLKETWERTEDGQLTSSFEPETHFELQRAYQLAINLQRLASAMDRSSPIAVATILERQFQRTPNWMLDDLEAAVKGMPGQISVVDAPLLSDAWDEVQAYGLPGAQLRLIQLLSRRDLATNAEQRSMIVARLSEATRNGHAAIRYAAALGLEPFQAEPLPGGNRCLETLMEMIDLEGQPQVLLISNDLGLRDHVSQLLAQVGYRSAHCQTAREAMRWIDQPHPVEAVMILDQVGDMNLTQLVQRLRAHFRGSQIPIAVLSEKVSSSQWQILEELGAVFRSFVPADRERMFELTDRLGQVHIPISMTSADRVVFKASAQNMIRELYEIPVEQRRFSIDQWNEWINARMPGSIYAETDIDTLRQLVSQASQWELVRRAIDSTRPVDERRQAAEALRVSFTDQHVKLSLHQMQTIYDAYNSQGRSDRDVRQYLGGILDALEATGAHRPK